MKLAYDLKKIWCNW